MDKVIFLLFILPFLIVQEGWQRFGKKLTVNDILNKVLYTLLIVLLIVFLGLLVRGYRLF